MGDNILVLLHPLRVGMGTRWREDKEETKHLRCRVMASRLQGEAEPVLVG